MNMSISGHQIDVTPALRDYVTEKVGKIEKHADQVTIASVVLHVEKNRHMAEATVHAKGAVLHADAEGDDMYAAIDALADKLDRQVLKHKGKTLERQRG